MQRQWTGIRLLQRDRGIEHATNEIRRLCEDREGAVRFEHRDDAVSDEFTEASVIGRSIVRINSPCEERASRTWAPRNCNSATFSSELNRADSECRRKVGSVSIVHKCSRTEFANEAKSIGAP
jgi:hypothetical protein